MDNQTGWVIERYHSSILVFWSGRDADHWGDIHHAVRFARRTDSERMLEWQCDGIGRVVEHMWCPLIRGTEDTTHD